VTHGLAATHPLDALLLDCLHRDPSRVDRTALTKLSEAEWEDLAARARRQRVRPMLYKRLAADGTAIVPEATRNGLKAACASIALSNMVLYAELAVLVRALDAENIPVIALKGIHVATAVYGDIGTREMSDIDLLVPRECLERAGTVALARGYTSTQPFSVATDIAVSHHLAALTKGRVRIEIHWNIVEPRRSFSVDPDPLIERSVALAIPGAGLRALAHEDLVLHLCAHAAYQHRFEFGLRSLCDLAMLVERHGDTIDWAMVVQRADAWGWTRAVHLTLDLAREMLGARVPDEVLRSLGADLDDRVRAAARTEMLAGWEGLGPALPYGVSSLAKMGGAGDIWRHLKARVLVEPEELVRRQGVAPESSRWIGLLYVQRAIRLVRRDALALVRLLLLRDTGLTEKTDRRDRLMAWLGLSAH
jgi:hypothetical protein